MSKNINTGKIKGTVFSKSVKFSKAVLWKSRELSLPVEKFVELKQRKIEKLLFLDSSKNEQWEFRFDQVVEKAKLKVVGQEPQYYFPIELAKKMPIEEVVSNCCDAPVDGEDTCSDCKEHCKPEKVRLFDVPVNNRR